MALLIPSPATRQGAGRARTPRKLEDPDLPHAEGGFADDVYVEDEPGELRRGDRPDLDPDDAEVTEAPGVPDDPEDRVA